MRRAIPAATLAVGADAAFPQQAASHACRVSMPAGVGWESVGARHTVGIAVAACVVEDAARESSAID